MAKGINPGKRRCYVLKVDKDLARDEQSRFLYQILKAEKYAQIQDKLVEVLGGDTDDEKPKSKTMVLSGTQVLEILCAGLVGVENYTDEDGTPILWPEAGGKAAKLDFLTTLKRAWRQELAEAILEGQTFTEKQVGESASPSGPA